MFGWLRDYLARREQARRDAEEKEFFDEWDEQGWPDYRPVTGEEIWPTKDPATGKWSTATERSATAKTSRA